MEGERILKALLNGETDDLFEDTKNYLSPLRSPLNAKNGCKLGCKVAEESVSKYTLFSTKFLRCAIETLKKVKTKGKHLDEITNSLNLVSTLLSDTLAIENGKYLKFIPSLDQLGKTIYLIMVQLISKSQFDKAFCHASDLLKFIQVVKSWKNYDSGKMEKELSSLATRTSDALLQGAGKLEEVKVTATERASHLCVVLDWRRLSLLFQVEEVTPSSLKSLVDKTLKCGTKYQLDCGQKNVDFKYLTNFFESVFNKLMVKFGQLIIGCLDSILFVAELGFHYGRSCSKAGMSMQALDVFDKLLEISRNVIHTKNGHSKLHTPHQICCCICFIGKATILLNCSSNPTSEALDSLETVLSEGSRLLSQLLKCKGLSSSMLKVVSDSLEYFRVTLQNYSTKETKKATPLSWRICQEAMQLLKLYGTILSRHCELIKNALHKASSDNLILQYTQQLQKITARQLTLLNFVISSYQDQLKSEEKAKVCDRSSRIYILRECFTVAQQANKVIQNALEDPDIPMSPNELRWLGSSVYNVGCVSYKSDCFAEGVPLLALACDELKIWSFGAETEEKIVLQAEEVKLLTKYALLVDCQRRAGGIRDALKTATTLVLIALKTTPDAHIIKQQVKLWASVKHELTKNLQNGEKLFERSRTLCSAFAEQEDAEDVEESQLCFVLQEELACYKAKSYDTAVEQIAVIKQIMELYLVQEDEFHHASAMLELAIALHSLGDVELEEENITAQSNIKVMRIKKIIQQTKEAHDLQANFPSQYYRKCIRSSLENIEDVYQSALEYCQEAGEILEQLLDSEGCKDEEGNLQACLLDRLGAVYLWQALFEHKDAMNDRATSAMQELSDSYEAEEIEDICLEQPFMASLHAALETWKALRTKSLQQDPSGKVNLDHFINPEETYHYLLITAEMFGLLKQPLKKVGALYVAASISQSFGTKDMLDSGLCALSDAVHLLCDMLDLSHASVILSHATNLMNRFEPCSTSWVQFLLAKSHYLLVTGKFSEGEDSLKEASESEVFTHKSYKSHLLKARWQSICCKYAMFPPTVHEFKIVVDPLLGSLTPLEWAIDELHKLTQMAEEIFGLDVFCTGKQMQKQEENLSDLLFKSEGSGQSLFRLSILNDLLSALLQVGQLYAHQGAVREALRQFVDGITLARQFCLPYRTMEFLINIVQLEVMQGKTEKSQCRVDQVQRILQPTMKSESKSKLSECCVQEPLFTEHPQTCECVGCLDPVLHAIFVEYLMSLSNHLALTSRPEQSLLALDVANLVCETAMYKIKHALKRLDAVVYPLETNDESSKRTKKRKGANSGRGRKQKKDAVVTECSISQSMFSQHQVTLHCMNAKTLLQNGNLTKANLVLSEAMVLLHYLENVNQSTPAHLVHHKAILLHLQGVAVLLGNRNLASEVSVDHNWFYKTQMNTTSCGSTEENPVVVVDDEEPELEMPRKASNRKTRTSKAVEKTSTLDNGRKKSSRAKGRGKNKKVTEEHLECEKSDANPEQKPKQQTRKPSKAICCDVGDHIQASVKQLNQAIQYFSEAFNLCQVCPPPALFSDICQGLAFCLGRSAPELTTYYLNLSMSVTLRHQAVTRTGKRIKRLAKDFSQPLPENKEDLVQLAEHLSSLSLDESSTDNTHHKLAALVKTRNIMKFSLCANERGKLCLFTPEEISLLQNMPKEWTVCTLETFTHPVSKDRELLISRMRAGCDPAVVKINTTSGEEQSKDCIGDEVVMDLSKLFQSGVLEEFADIMSDSIKSMNINNTAEWWALRTRLDRRMKNLLEKIEGSWLGRWRGVLLGQPVSQERHESVASLARELEEKILVMCGYQPDYHLLEVLIDSSFCLSRKETAEALIEITGMDATLPSFEKLLDEVENLTGKLFEDRDKKSSINRSGDHSAENIARHPVILILGKEIQHLPWESIPMLFDQPVTRVPSLQYLLSKLSCQRQLPEINPEKTFYALNPQNNLPNTQKMFQKWFESEDGWQGITGNAPTQEQFRSALTDHDLFIYFGHGTGREFLQGDDIQRLDCRAVTLLMGCSSGKLQVGGECEPRGMALNYLLAGCPAIVANLWDVTDKDIDRFSELLLKQWLQSGLCLSLPQVLSQSRQACKLKYLIGASPVLYGLPAYTKEQND